jgi:hypothetical protein
VLREAGTIGEFQIENRTDGPFLQISTRMLLQEKLLSQESSPRRGNELPKERSPSREPPIKTDLVDACSAEILKPEVAASR